MPRTSKLTEAQEVVVRTFLRSVKDVDLKMPNTWLMELYERMGYKVAPNGALVHMDLPLRLPYNTPAKDYWEDVYETDGEAFIGPDAETNTSTSQSSEGN